MASRDQNQRLDDLMGGYADTGLPLTAQRRALLEVLASREDHPTVDLIFEALAQRIPEVSRTTVYRSLETMAGLGLLNRVEHPGSAVRFDPNTAPHHHFLCSLCGALRDLPDSALTGAAELAFHPDGPYLAQEISILVRGHCQSCATPAVE
ncbi:MAG: Fur family transcriptional regulator [Planctomycetota bacterium]